MEEILDIFLDSLIDSLKVLGICVVIYILLSFVEEKMSKFLIKHKHTAPITASLFGLVPQCGFSVVSADLYIKNHITVGTLFAAFFACSDEALPILLSDFNKAIYTIPLLLIKLILGFVFGYSIDLILHKKYSQLSEEEDVESHHVGCCHHHIDDEEESKIKTHLVHPFIHSLKIFAYVFVISFLFGLLVWAVGEENMLSFLTASKWATPVLSSIVGLIPNCASSALITEAFLENALPFGALVSGLCVNAGLGLLFLFKNKEKRKNSLYILITLFTLSALVGYAVMGIMELF